MKETTFDLKAEDAAIIFKQDGGVELILPKIDDEETVDYENNQNIFIAMAVASAMDDVKFREFIVNKVELMFEAADAMMKEGENAEG